MSDLFKDQNKYYELLEKLSRLEDEIKKALIIKNVLNSRVIKEAKTYYDDWDSNTWKIEELRAEYYPMRTLWNEMITLYIYPRKGEFIDESARIELEINENKVLVNIDDIIQFLKEIECNKWLEGIDEIDKKLDVFK